MCLLDSQSQPPCNADWPGSLEPGIQFPQSAHTLRTHLEFASQLEVPWEADPPNLWTLGKRSEWERAKRSPQGGSVKLRLKGQEGSNTNRGYFCLLKSPPKKCSQDSRVFVSCPITIHQNGSLNLVAVFLARLSPSWTPESLEFENPWPSTPRYLVNMVTEMASGPPPPLIHPEIIPSLHKSLSVSHPIR